MIQHTTYIPLLLRLLLTITRSALTYLYQVHRTYIPGTSSPKVGRSAGLNMPPTTARNRDPRAHAETTPHTTQGETQWYGGHHGHVCDRYTWGCSVMCHHIQYVHSSIYTHKGSAYPTPSASEGNIDESVTINILGLCQLKGGRLNLVVVQVVEAGPLL